MEVKITQAMLDEVRSAGACRDALARYRPGIDVSAVASSDLQWVEQQVPRLAAQIAAQLGVPLWAAGYGYGDGDGYGAGYGAGAGYGYGYGYGAGYGYGDGDGAFNA